MPIAQPYGHLLRVVPTEATGSRAAVKGARILRRGTVRPPYATVVTPIVKVCSFWCVEDPSTFIVFVIREHPWHDDR